jgi:hypothetical protein
LIFLLSISIRLLNLDQPLGDNEIFHILAARSWMEDGTFRVAEGSYTRASYFTILLAGFFTFFDASTPFIARLPAVLAGSFLVVALFVWVQRETNRFAAWVAAIVLCCAPMAIEMSQFVRFYALHALTFWFAAVGTYVLVTHRLSGIKGTLLALLIAGLFSLSLHLQIITLVGMAGVFLWVFCEIAGSRFRHIMAFARPWWVPTIALILVVISVTFVFASGLGEQLLSIYRKVPPHATKEIQKLWLYHYLLLEQYPTLWSLLPVALIVAIARKRRFGLFCACVFLTVVIVQSGGGRKSVKYIYYAMPFFFALWGFVLAEAIPYLRRRIIEVLEGIPVLASRPRVGHAVAWSIVGVVMTFLVVSNSIAIPVYRTISGPGVSHPNWEAARTVLQPWLKRSLVVMASPMSKTLYYLGRGDIEFGQKYIYESNPQEEFGIDYRTGLRAISRVDSLKLMFGCYQRGLFIMETRRWRRRGVGPTPEVENVLIENTQEIPLPKEWGLRALAWEKPESSWSPKCSVLRPLKKGT